jgi:hypothetical protein
VELSQYVLEALREDEEFVLYRGEHSKQPSSPSVLLLAPASTHPVLETLKKIGILIEGRTGLGLGGSAPIPFRANGDHAVLAPRLRSRNGTRRVAQKGADS